MRTLWTIALLTMCVALGCTADYVPLTDAGPLRPAMDAAATAEPDAAAPEPDATTPADRDAEPVMVDALPQDAATVPVDSSMLDLDMAAAPIDAGDAASEEDGALDVGDTAPPVLMDAALNLPDGAVIELDAGRPVQCVGPQPRIEGMPPAPIPEEQCMNCIGAPSPTWRMEDFQPLSCGFEQTYGLDSFTQPAANGRATLVALFNAGCGYCRGQAEQMDRMRIEMRLQGHDAYFVALNGHRYEVHQEGLAARCSFPLLQDTEELMGLEAMDGAIYDMFVYRPDGTLHVFLPGFGGPDTYLSEDEGYANVRAAVLAAISGEPYEPPHPRIDIILPDGGLPDAGQ